MKDREEIESLVGRMLDEAIQWHESELEPLQEAATDYYMGRPFGNEEEGRSQVVMTEVRDVVLAKMPSLLRIFFGAERVVEFKPKQAEDVPVAAQQTEYVNHIITEDNPGFMTLYSAIQDAEIRKLGIIKWWWEDQTRVEEAEYTGLGEQELFALASDAEVFDVVIGEDGSYSCRARVTHSDGRARIAAVPPEEFVFSPQARSLEDARLVAHVREMPADELLAMGIDEDLVERAKQKTREKTSDTLEGSRRVDEHRDWSEDEQDDSTLPILFAEAYVKLDADGDGISELRLLQCVGPEWEIANGEDLPGEVVDEKPFALFCPIPEAHTIVGLSDADLVMDLQKINSSIVRGVLDSLGATLDPATEVVEGEVNMGDILNRERGRIIRSRRPGMMREIVTPFVGADALPVLAWLDERKESRTGVTKAAAGLDADVLQSTTKAAVEMTREGSKQHLEMTARIYAETGMKQLFKGLLRLVCRHQDQPRVVRLRNEFVGVDPRQWDANMDVTVNVALGSGSTEEKIQALSLMLQKQEEHYQMGSPLVGISEIRNTLGMITELLGYKDSSKFWRPFGPAEEQAYLQAKSQQPQQPDPNMALVQVEAMKNEMKAQTDMLKLHLDQMKIMLEDDRERDKIARDTVLEEHKIEAEFTADIHDQELAAKIEKDRIAQQANESA